MQVMHRSAGSFIGRRLLHRVQARMRFDVGSINSKHSLFLEKVVELASKNAQNGGRPFAALIEKNGEVISSSGCKVCQTKDVTAHAEIEVIREASKKLDTLDLSECTLYISCEPCQMCLGAIFLANLKGCYYSANKKDA